MTSFGRSDGVLRSGGASEPKQSATHRDATHRDATTSAAKRTHRAGGIGASASNTERDLNRRAPSEAKQPARPAGRHPRFGADVEPSGPSRHVSVMDAPPNIASIERHSKTA